MLCFLQASVFHGIRQRKREKNEKMNTSVKGTIRDYCEEYFPLFCEIILSTTNRSRKSVMSILSSTLS